MVKMVQGSGQLSGEEWDVRLEDYLNDQLQTTEDLENLDALLENTKTQQILLREQVHCKALAHRDSKVANHVISYKRSNRR